MKKLGKYELLEPLGEGATAYVFHARETLLQREVALKILKPALVADQASFQRFVQEARAAAGLFHAHLATVLEMDEADGRYYIAMRYVDGPSLDKILEESGPLSLENSLRMAAEIGGALDFAHGEGFLHRDVKPANILRDSKGAFWLTDFGLTKAMMSTGLTSHTGAILGTTPYVPPEIWNNREACPATDQYALACAVYEALTGEVLFAAKTPMGVMNRHSQPRELSAVPDTLRPALQRALDQEPEERFPSSVAFAESLAAEPELKHDLELEKQPEPLEVAVQPAMVEQPERAEAATTVVSSQQADVKPAVAVERKTGASKKGWLLAGGMAFLGLLGVAVVIGLVSLINGIGKSIAMPELVEEPAAVAATATDELPTEIPTEEPTETPTVEPVLDTGSTMISEKDGMEMVFVPAGAFTMGSNDGFEDEQPVHEVYLDGYWIDKYEVNNEQFTLFMDEIGYETDAEQAGQSFVYVDGSWEQVSGADWAHPKGPTSGINGLSDHPVVHVSWNDAQDYCTWAGRRLPTEAEWEKAARGTDGRIYPWGNEIPSVSLLNYDQNEGGTTVVGSYPAGASPYGVMDMAGNVWEWTADWYDGNYYSVSPDKNPTGPSSGKDRVLRGGSWGSIGRVVRSANRLRYNPDSAYNSYGFPLRQLTLSSWVLVFWRAAPPKRNAGGR